MGYMQNSTNFKVSKNTRSLKHIFFPEKIAIPLNFDDDKKHVVEIGFGNGELITRMAKARSRDMFIGIENSEISCIKTAKKAVDFGINNLTIFHGDAKFLIHEIFESSSVDLILSFYPIPWPKNSHENKRLFSESFLKNVVNSLKPSGRFVIVTDDRDHADWITSNAKNAEIHLIKREIMPLRATKYGRKWKEMGRTSWSITMNGQKFDVTRMVSVQMPHVHLKDISIEKLEDISSKKFVENEIVIQFRGLFTSTEGYLLKTVSVDDGFVQTYYIILKKEEGGWLARLDDGIRVFKTPAVKKSIEIIGNFMVNV